MTILKKDVYERYLLRADLANQSSEDAQPKRLRRVYCTLSTFCGLLYSITTWANSSCLF